jgi:ferredoxin
MKNFFWKKNRNVLRILLQASIIVSVLYVAADPILKGTNSDFEAYCPFGGLASLGSKLNQGTMSCTMSEVQMFLGVGLIVGVLLVGKLFCGFLCPVGSISEWLANIGERFNFRFEITGLVDRLLRLMKYALLFATLYFTMTTSELFCKKFDPYYAVANLFNNTDIVLFYAIPAVIIAIVGSVVTRLFWCKYLCPLSALSNIFMNAAGAGLVIIVFIALKLGGIEISYIWLLAGLILVGIVTEIGFKRSFLTPLPKITRNDDNCTDCVLCDKKCPQGIAVSQYRSVDHIDCTLCTDCLYICPRKNTLTIANQHPRVRYFVPATVIVLVALSMGAASKFELTTISERWNGFDSLKTIAVYRQSGLKNVKCFSSSKSLKTKLEVVQGIYGLDTYARSHTVDIYYDSTQLNAQDVKHTLFAPTKEKVRDVVFGENDSVAILTVGIYELFDAVDFDNYFILLQSKPAIFGFESEYGEPVRTTIFYDAKRIDPEAIVNLIEQESVDFISNGRKETISLSFKCDHPAEQTCTISSFEYRKRMFTPYNSEFYIYEDYSSNELQVFVFPMPEADDSKLSGYRSWLASHLSDDEGIVRFATYFTTQPMGFIYYDPLKTNEKNIRNHLISRKIKVFFNDTEFTTEENPFHIDPSQGRVVKATLASPYISDK